MGICYSWLAASRHRWSDTIPLHLLAKEDLDAEREVARVIVNEPGLWELYAPYLSVLHEAIWKEAKRMAREKKKRIEDYLNFQPLIETEGMEAVIKALGVEKVINAIGIDELLAHLTPCRFVN